jgi:hypothetical protein
MNQSSVDENLNLNGAPYKRLEMDNMIGAAFVSKIFRATV